MKFTHTLLAATVSAALALSLSACNNSGGAGQSGNTAATATSTAPGAMASESTAAPAMPASTAAMPATGGTTASGTMPASSSSIGQLVASNQQSGDNWFGGPVYNGKPDLAATAALVKAGGGAEDFDFSKALVAMLGKDTVNKEVAKLTKQYGKQAVDNYVNGMTFVVTDALKHATEEGIKLPAPANVHGKDLAKAVVKLGTAPDGTFWSGYLFDHTVSHKIHQQVMADIDAKDGQAADANTHKIDNQAMYDVAQALGQKDVKLASFH